MSDSLMHILTKKLTEDTVKQIRAKMAPRASVKGEGEFEVVATTESVDREGEILLTEGWDFKNYLNNPIVLWGHDWYSKPIGAVTDIQQEDGKIIMKGVFAPTEQGQEVRALYESGILRTVSVGYLVKERNGPVLTKMEMIELSFVAVPANPEAMTTAQKTALKKLEKSLSYAVKDTEQEKPKEVIEQPEKLDGDTTKIDLPKSTDSVEPEAKGVGMKVGRVLSAKNITAMQGARTGIASIKTGLDELDKVLADIIESASTDKTIKEEEERKALIEVISGKTSLVSKLMGEVNMLKKKL